MKIFKFFLAFWMLLDFGFSQVFDPVSWSTSVEEKEGETYLVITAKIDKGWHLYSQSHSGETGIATEFSYTASDKYELVGKTNEPKPQLASGDGVGDNALVFENSVTFKQKITTKQSSPFTIEGEVYFMVCDDQRCLPPNPELLTFNITSSNNKKESLENSSDETGNNKEQQLDNIEKEESELESDTSVGILDPVRWSFSTKKITNTEYEIVAKAKIDPNWHVYATKLESDDGPAPTEFVINENKKVNKIGDIEERGTIKSEYDENFGMQLHFFEDSLILIRRISIKDGSKPILSGEIYFMVCDDEKCLPPTSEPFKIDVVSGKLISEHDQSENDKANEIIPYLENFDLEKPINDCGGEENTGGKSLWVIFLLGLGGGLFALVTPCVYPMIPLTVSFFTKGGEDRKKGLFRAALYGFFIFLIYVSLSIPFHVSDMDPQILNGIATNPYLNIAFFAIFVFFAFSFLGYYELTLPSKWSNRSDEASNRGGFIGVFFMALTLALVSFSCTGPILGSVLAGVLKDGAMPLTVALAGFGIALGLPFAVFAAFPSLMKSIPQSGGWLNSVKVVLGFLELGLALKFLSNADLVEQWGLLKREVFFGIWILLGLGLVAYLFNLIRFPHDSKNRKLTFPKIAFALLFLSFVIYLIPGVTCGENSNRRLVSGFPPPMFYSYCSDGGKCPLNLDCHKDFEEGREIAENVDKPILLDFTGWACVNCREVEENIWPDEEVYKLINEEFVLISLYVDDKRALPENEQGVVEIKYDNGKVKKKKIKTVGDKWFTFETLTFRNNSQPRYALLAPDGTLLNNPISYKDIKDNGYEEFYAEFLRCGLDAYQKLKQTQ